MMASGAGPGGTDQSGEDDNPPRNPTPEEYAPYLELSFPLPRIVYREVGQEDVTANDFVPYGTHNPRADHKDRVDELCWNFGISVWVKRDKVVQRITQNETAGRVAMMDISEVPWARIALLRHGPQFHFELFGEARHLVRCVKTVEDPEVA
jgi:hypothetical protein